MGIDEPDNGGDWVGGGELRFHDVFAAADHRGTAPIGVRALDKARRQGSSTPIDRAAIRGVGRCTRQWSSDETWQTPQRSWVLGPWGTAAFTLLSHRSRGAAQLAESAGRRRFDGKLQTRCENSPACPVEASVANGTLCADCRKRTKAAWHSHVSRP